jgi:uncharacterized protein (DUF427 family)
MLKMSPSRRRTYMLEDGGRSMTHHLEDISIGRLAEPCLPNGFRWESSPRRVRVVFGGEAIADSTHVMLLLEAGHLPVFYFPQADVRAGVLERTEHTTSSDLKGAATYWTVRAGDRVAENAAWSYDSPPPGGPDIKGYVAFYWNEMDAWYEEDELAVAHARDPYKLVDVRQSSRHVQVVLDGVAVADTHHPKLLFETGLPVRYYIPPEDVRMDLLEPTETTSQCAYKGQASYWSARVGERVLPDVAWGYREPLALAAQVAGMVCFFQERADAIIVDGEPLERPQTPWSR